MVFKKRRYQRFRDKSDAQVILEQRNDQIGGGYFHGRFIVQLLFHEYLPIIFIACGAITQTDDGMEPEFLKAHGVIGKCTVFGTTCRNLPKGHQVFAGEGII